MSDHLTRDECINLAQQWNEAAARDYRGFSNWKVAHASATIALTYATLATVAPIDKQST